MLAIRDKSAKPHALPQIENTSLLVGHPPAKQGKSGAGVTPRSFSPCLASRTHTDWARRWANAGRRIWHFLQPLIDRPFNRGPETRKTHSSRDRPARLQGGDCGGCLQRLETGCFPNYGANAWRSIEKVPGVVPISDNDRRGVFCAFSFALR